MLAFSRANCTNTPQSGLAYHPSRAASAYAGRLPPALSLSMPSSDFLLLLLLFLTLPLSSVDAAPSWLGNLRPSNARSKDGRTDRGASVGRGFKCPNIRSILVVVRCDYDQEPPLRGWVVGGWGEWMEGTPGLGRSLSFFSSSLVQHRAFG